MATATLAALVLSGGSCAERSAPHAREALRVVGRALEGHPPLDDLLRLRRRLATVGQDEVTDSDWGLRRALLRHVDEAILSRLISDIDRSLVIESLVTARFDASEIVSRSSRQVLTPEFTEHAEEVTADAVKAVACQEILDALAPDEKPPEPGEASTVGEAAQEAAVKLAAYTAPGEVRAVLDFSYWSAGVTKAATQYVHGIDGYSTEQVPNPSAELLSNPFVSRAAVTYLRACFSPPKRP